MRRGILVLAACAAVALSLAGCGGSRRAGGGHRVFNAGVCAFSVWRATHDARTHHFGFAAFQAYLAIHHCPRVFHRR